MQSENKSPEYQRQPGAPCSGPDFGQLLSVGNRNRFSQLELVGTTRPDWGCQKFCCVRKKSLNESGAGRRANAREGLTPRVGQNYSESPDPELLKRVVAGTLSALIPMGLLAITTGAGRGA
jgi:hypothetical protein